MRSGVKRFRKEDGSSLLAFEGVNLSVRRQEFVCVLGPSGCGKTTMLRCLSGLEELSEGTVLIHGEEPRGVHRDLAIVFQRPVLLPWLTVADNVQLPLRVGGYARASSPAASRDRVAALLDLVGLKGFESSYPYELSGGMQQRASIARALSRNPDILMMDEPFGALDALTRQRLNFELVRIWRSSGSTIVLITHNIHEALILADRVVVMSERPGRIIKELAIDLPRPRTAKSLNAQPERYLALVKDIEECLGVAE
ncbi:MAG: ABC transporter ATP-binding protein [Burkholderiales bacterium]|nr:ABC transporter ATP-binding protein [Burkholderiales bacterium]